MRVLIPLFFNAPLGGLHSNVRAQVNAINATGWDPVVMCRPGPFADELTAAGHSVLRTTFDDHAKAVAQALAAGPFDIVHAHPFRSRAVGVEVARVLDVPLIITHHGPYLDRLPQHANDVDFLLAVSGAARDVLARDSGVPAERIVVLHNGVDLGRFRPRDVSDERLLELQPAIAPDLLAGAPRRVLFASRLHVDKRFIVDAVIETLDRFASTDPKDAPVWLIAGEGELRAELERAAERLAAAREGRSGVVFLGWQEEAALPDLYSAVDLTVAPGRCAIEAMACAKPVIAIGSRGYVGLLDDRAALRGAHENFGGYGHKHEDYRAGAMYDDITRGLASAFELERLGRLGRQLATTLFDQTDLDRQLIGLYGLAIATRPRRRLPVP